MKLTYKDDGHEYYLDGVRCKGVTTAAKIPDDTYNLDLWQKRMVAIGLAMSPPLVERVAAHYDDKKHLNRICEEAMTAAKAHEAGGRGTAAHRITERIDLDQMVIDTELAKTVRALWNKTLDDAGLDVVPEYIERIIVFPDQRICGRLDRYCRRRSDGRLVVVDLKTGESAIRYPHAPACQMGMYVNAPLMAAPLPPEGGTTTDFEPLPDELDRDRGVIIHMPAEDQAEAVEIDIAAGWDTVQRIIFPILDWRKRKDLAQIQIPRRLTNEIPAAGDTASPVGGDGAVEPVPHQAPAPSTRPVVGSQPGVTRLPTPHPDRVMWVRAWIKAIGEHPERIDQLAQHWPQGVSTPKQGGWTNDDIDRIADVCAQVDAVDGAPFWPPDPTTPTPTSKQTARSK